MYINIDRTNRHIPFLVLDHSGNEPSAFAAGAEAYAPRCAQNAPRLAAPPALLWEELLAGLWRISQRIDGGAARLVVALPARGETSLSPLQQQIAQHVSQGRAVKQTAHALGLRPATVRRHLLRIQQIMKLDSRCELIAFFSANGVRTRLTTMRSDGTLLLIGSYALARSAPMDTAAPAHRAADLTCAEAHIAKLAGAGVSNSAIAQRRGTHVRTVANQLQAIYRKLGVRSRMELAACLHQR